MPKNIIGLIKSLAAKIISFPNYLAMVFISTVFKYLLVPAYKFFLFFKKNFIYNQALPHGRFLTTQNNKPAIHVIIITVALFVLFNNFSTRDIYAEEFNKSSILAHLFTDELNEIMIDNSGPLEATASSPHTENTLNELSAITTANTTTSPNPSGQTDKHPTLTQSDSAVIMPVITPFASDDETPAENPASSSSRNSVQQYIVQAGDTLSDIAQKFNINTNTILWENNLSLASYIRPGDKLTILPIDGISYTVKSGDTISAIASRFDSKISDIVNFNQLQADAILKIRQKIIIPGGRLGATNPAPAKSAASLAKAFGQSNNVASDENLVWPSPVSKRITQYYHWGHNAIDIATKSGTPIVASRSGRIVRSGWSEGYGYNIVIDHGDGVQTLYGHASKLLVERGDQVNQGETIAEVGSTGWSTGPHIHFEIIIHGTKVNPLSHL